MASFCGVPKIVIVQPVVRRRRESLSRISWTMLPTEEKPTLLRCYFFSLPYAQSYDHLPPARHCRLTCPACPTPHTTGAALPGGSPVRTMKTAIVLCYSSDSILPRSLFFDKDSWLQRDTMVHERVARPTYLSPDGKERVPSPCLRPTSHSPL